MIERHTLTHNARLVPRTSVGKQGVVEGEVLAQLKTGVGAHSRLVTAAETIAPNRGAAQKRQQHHARNEDDRGDVALDLDRFLLNAGHLIVQDPELVEQNEHRGDEAGLEGEDLRVGDRGDEEAEAEGAEQVEEHRDQEVEVRAADLDPEQHPRRDQDDERREEGDAEVGDRLAEDELPGAQRRDAQLLHRPPLLLPHDREGGREDRGHHEQEADEPGDEELRRLGLRVEQDAGLEHEGGLRPPTRALQGLRDEGPVLLRDQRAGVAEHGLGGGRVGAVEEELDRGGAPGREIAAVALGDDQHRADDAPLEQPVEGGYGGVLPFEHQLVIDLVRQDVDVVVLGQIGDARVTVQLARNAGVLPVPMYPPLALGRIDNYLDRAAGILRVSGAKALLTTQELLPVFQPVRDQLPTLGRLLDIRDLQQMAADPAACEFSALPEEACFLQFTSGSTSLATGSSTRRLYCSCR